MIALGIICLVLGLVLAIPVLRTVGLLLLVIGVLLFVVSAASGAGWYAYY